MDATTTATPQTIEQPLNLYEKLGGEAAVNAAVDIFYKKVLADSLLAPFFAHVEMTDQIRKQKIFLMAAFGGPQKFTGKSLRKAHAPMVKDQGLSDQHFDAVAGHLKTSLEELNVPANLVNEVLAIAESTR